MSQRVVCQFSKAEICNLFPRLIASKYRIKRLGGALYSVLQIDLGLEGVVQENVGRLDVPVYDPRMACMYVQDQLLISRTDKQASYPGRTGASHDELVRPSSLTVFVEVRQPTRRSDRNLHPFRPIHHG